MWGDALNREDVIEACKGIDWCLHVMALISPAADRDPETAHRVNYLATKTIVEAIEAQDPEAHPDGLYRIGGAIWQPASARFRLARTGDPIAPSEFDTYALSKIQCRTGIDAITH